MLQLPPAWFQTHILFQENMSLNRSRSQEAQHRESPLVVNQIIRTGEIRRYKLLQGFAVRNSEIINQLILTRPLDFGMNANSRCEKGHHGLCPGPTDQQEFSITQQKNSKMKNWWPSIDKEISFSASLHTHNMVHNKVYRNTGLSPNLDFQVWKYPGLYKKITRDWFYTWDIL